MRLRPGVRATAPQFRWRNCWETSQVGRMTAAASLKAMYACAEPTGIGVEPSLGRFAAPLLPKPQTLPKEWRRPKQIKFLLGHS